MPIPVEAIFDDVSMQSAAYLDISFPGKESYRRPLNEGEIFIGREDERNISLPSSGISRKHARIFSKGEQYLVEDLDSTNGTFVNNVKISKCVLKDQDQIRIAEATIRFINQKFRRKQ